MTVIQAFRDGIRRVHRAPAVLLGVWLLALLVSPPVGLTAPTIDPFLEVHRPGMLASAGTAYIVLWLFLSGGIIDRYARDRATRAHGFFGASGVFFFRFLRLALVFGVVYWLVDALSPGLTSDMRDVVFGGLVAACTLIVDYAQVRAVVEDRRSVIGAIGASVSFVRHAPATLALHGLDLGLLLLLRAGYAVVAPAMSGAWPGLAIGQGYLLARLWLRLVFWASETALFQSRFAHAGYVAAPMATWPESPAAEAFRNSKLKS